MSLHDPGQGRRIDFDRVGGAARRNAEAVVRAFAPEGRREGNEWIFRNPKREDRTLGSAKCNLVTGKWADFATGDKGGDLVGLVAWLQNVSQRSAAIQLAAALGVCPYE